jgi:HTH-type transcriptional regulator/antitoxin HipB
MQIRTAKDLGAAIKQARAKRGLTQTELAQILGIDQARISTIERGSPGVSVGAILRILAALDARIVIRHGGTATNERSHRPKRPHELVDLDAIANAGLDPWPTKR